MKRTLTTLVAATVVSVPTAAQDRGIPLGSDVERAVQTITPEDIIARIGALAHDSMRGRDTPSPELDKAAAWIGSEFAGMGLAPGGDDGSFIQRYPIARIRMNVPASGLRWGNGNRWQMGRDVGIPTPNYSPTGPEGVTGAAVALVGRARNADAYSGLGLAGKVVFWLVPTDRQGNPDPAGVNDGFAALMGSRPAGVVLIMDRPQSQWNRMVSSLDRVRTVTGWADTDPLPILEVRSRTAQPVLAAAGIDVDLVRNRPLEVRDLRQNATITLARETLQEDHAPNVVAILEGSDPALRHEYIVYSAHMDHVGVGRPVNGDSIYNGADDDASGTAGIMEVAEAFAALNTRPRRSLIFLAVSGEEHGLWGSDFFAANPPVPIDQIVANLNADMIGRNWPDTIVVIGKEHSDLGRTLNRVNAAHPELNMTAIDDLWPEENFYFRSDHFNFARRGVPVLFFFNGTHDDYHRPSDEVGLIDEEKESRIVKLLFYLGLEVANAADRPVWNPESYRQIVGDTR